MPSYVVTGASRGLGFEFVKQLSDKPENQVFAVARNPTASAKLVELQKSRPNVHAVKADVVDPDSLKAAADAVAAKTSGTLDYLINNAALSGATERSNFPLSNYPSPKLLEQDLQEHFTINAIGVVHTTNAFLPLLHKGTAKKLITLSTGVADADFTLQTGVTFLAAYAISKAALNMVVTRYANELAPLGFTVIALSPGLVNTSESTAPPTPEEIEGFTALVTRFQKAAPYWDGKPIDPTTSVKDMLDVVGKLGPEDSGKFLSHHGDKNWL